MTAEFLHPYGAFELKTGARQRMAWGAAGSAFLVVTAVMAAVSLTQLARQLSPTDKPVIQSFPGIDLFPLPPTRNPGGRPVDPRASASTGQIVPVKDSDTHVDGTVDPRDLGLANAGIDGPAGGVLPNGDEGLRPGAGPADRPDPSQVPIVDEYPVLLKTVTPRYPDLAREAGVEGQVLLKVLVNREGRVDDVIVLHGVGLLSEAAVAAARLYVFRPATSDHRPVAVWVAIPMTFRLRGN